MFIIFQKSSVRTVNEEIFKEKKSWTAFVLRLVSGDKQGAVGLRLSLQKTTSEFYWFEKRFSIYNYKHVFNVQSPFQNDLQTNWTQLGQWLVAECVGNICELVWKKSLKWKMLRLIPLSFFKEHSQKEFSMFIRPRVQFTKCLRCGCTYVRMQRITPSL